jgi:hypothetical protein
MAEVLVKSTKEIVKIPKKRGRKPKKKETDSLVNSTNLVPSTQNENDSINGSIIEPNNLPDDPNVKVKKKRGRKPKNMVETSGNKKEDNVITVRRRGRKPKDKFNYETANFSDYQNSIKRNENVIIKLPISCLKIEQDYQISNDVYQYNPNIVEPKPYDNEISEYQKLNTNDMVTVYEDDNIQNNSLLNNNDLLNTEPNTLNINSLNNNLNSDNTQTNLIDNNTDIDVNGSIFNPKTPLLKSNNPNLKTLYCPDKNQDDNLPTKTDNIRQIDLILNKKYNYNQEKIDIMNGFVANSTIRIQKTDICCWWCCHEFDTVPWGIPTKYDNEQFDLFGIFCSPNCALSYLLDTERCDDYLWEKVALLNLLYYKIYNKYETIIPSPNKIALIKFGGSLTIEEYHNLIETNNKSYTIEFPPCNNVIPVLEEIYKKTNLTNTFIPVDKNRIKKANNELKLKRNTPINSNKNTLDNCMNIKF